MTKPDQYRSFVCSAEAADSAAAAGSVAAAAGRVMERTAGSAVAGQVAAAARAEEGAEKGRCGC